MRLLVTVPVLAALIACGGSEPNLATSATPSARPSSTASLAIKAPKEGSIVPGPNVRVRVSLEGGRIIPATTKNLKPDEGHLHVLVDGRLISMTLGLSQEVEDLQPGAHVIRVEFVASDHVPFTPRLFREVSFQVAA